MWSSDGDLVLGLVWLKTLETFILNVEKTFLTFPYKNKKITLSDINMNTESEVASSKEFKEISKMLSQGNEKSIHRISTRLLQVKKKRSLA